MDIERAGRDSLWSSLRQPYGWYKEGRSDVLNAASGVHNQPVQADGGSKRIERTYHPQKGKVVTKQTPWPAVQIGFAFAGIWIVVSYAGDAR